MAIDNLSDGLNPRQIDLIVELIKLLQTPRFEVMPPYELAEVFGTTMAVILKERAPQAA